MRDNTFPVTINYDKNLVGTIRIMENAVELLKTGKYVLIPSLHITRESENIDKTVELIELSIVDIDHIKNISKEL